MIMTKRGAACVSVRIPVSYTHLDVYKRQGPQRATVLNKELNLFSLHDLLYYFPYPRRSYFTIRTFPLKAARIVSPIYTFISNPCLLYTSRLCLHGRRIHRCNCHAPVRAGECGGQLGYSIERTKMCIRDRVCIPDFIPL